ncbi:NAD+ synthetase [mine drainage metagenome]|uniref:NAD+ synthetase n=1 Tax=mine drainage metagenome TaxID=410659 RepID=T1BFB2_9ZZZZ
MVGLSGGIDSALTARLARDALGADRVLGVMLPDASYSPALLAETRQYAVDLGIAHRVVPIEPAAASLRGLLPEVTDPIDLGNLTARLRMIALYALARPAGRRVVGTGNKSELLLGYFTKYGDGGVDLLPLGDLYKTQVRRLAEALDLPRAVRERVPSAGLWEGQTDEAELGLPYDQLDRILHGLEQLRPPEEIAARTGLPATEVARVAQRVAANRHKRRPAPIPKIGLRTVGLDWRD